MRTCIVVLRVLYWLHICIADACDFVNVALALFSAEMVKHLAPAVKQLLTLRNPDAWPSPPVETLHRVFTSTLNEARQRNAENGWLVLSASTRSTLLIVCLTEPEMTDMHTPYHQQTLVCRSPLPFHN